MLIKCCEGAAKLFSKENYEKCVSPEECNGKTKEDNFCCVGYCMAKLSGLLKDDEIDKETALASLTAATDNDSKWTDVN
jgi:hypothetical protein